MIPPDSVGYDVAGRDTPGHDKSSQLYIHSINRRANLDSSSLRDRLTKQMVGFWAGAIKDAG